MESEKRLVEICIESKAKKAFLIEVEKIPFDESLRSYCEVNYCGSYGKNYACPPHVGGVNELIEKAKSYQKALVFQTVSDLKDSYDIEGMKSAAVNHSKVGERINEEIKEQYNHYLQLTAGGCTVCKTCEVVIDEPCKFPEKAISSLEAYCMNVALLAKRCDMNYINGQNTVTYFGVFLLNE